MEKAYILKYKNTAIFYFITRDKNKLDKFNKWIMCEENLYEFCFSPILKVGTIDNSFYITTQILDKSTDNVNNLKLELNNLFSIETYVENTKRKLCKKTQLREEALERIIELHK